MSIKEPLLKFNVLFVVENTIRHYKKERNFYVPLKKSNKKAIAKAIYEYLAEANIIFI